MLVGSIVLESVVGMENWGAWFLRHNGQGMTVGFASAIIVVRRS